MKARPVVLAAFAVFLAAGLTACVGSSKKSRTGVTTPGGLAQLYSGIFGTGHRYTLNQVKAAFATQGIKLRTMRRLRGGRVIVLFDPRWHAPVGLPLPPRRKAALGHAVPRLCPRQRRERGLLARGRKPLGRQRSRIRTERGRRASQARPNLQALGRSDGPVFRNDPRTTKARRSGFVARFVGQRSSKTTRLEVPPLYL